MSRKLQIWLFLISGYLNENGNLNLKNFEKYMEKLSEVRRHFLNMMANSQICKLMDSDI